MSRYYYVSIPYIGNRVWNGIEDMQAGGKVSIPYIGNRVCQGFDTSDGYFVFQFLI